jgi:hypothetical protein
MCDTNETYQGQEKVRLLLVLLLPKRSTMIFYKRSHLYALCTETGNIGLLEVSKESLEKEDIERVEVTMEEGGL